MTTLPIKGGIPEELIYLKEKTINVTNVGKLFTRIGGRKVKRGFLASLGKPKKKK